MALNSEGRYFEFITGTPQHLAPPKDILTLVHQIPPRYSGPLAALMTQLEPIDPSLRRTPVWHPTMSGVYAGEVFLDEERAFQLCQHAFVAAKSAFDAQYELTFTHVRPGIAGKDEHGNAIGAKNLILMASSDSSAPLEAAAAKFLRLLEPEAELLGIKLKKPLPGIWVTLATLETSEDIPIQGALQAVLDSMQKLDIRITIDSIALLHATRTTLEDARAIEVIHLPRLGGPGSTIPQRVEAVVTQQYCAKDDTATRRALEAVRRIGLRQPILQIDEKDPRGERNAECAGIAARVQKVDVYSTARRWYHGLSQAFSDSAVSAVLLWPGDLAHEVAEDQVGILQQIIADANAETLHLVDYSSNDSFKQDFDELVTWKLLELLYPKEAQAARELGCSKMRTEVMVVGRKVFEHFRTASKASWGTDPTIQLLIQTLREAALRAKVTQLGELKDDSGTRNAAGQALQITRIIDQEVNDKIVEANLTAKGAEGQLAEYDRLRSLIQQAEDLKRRALEENRQRIALMSSPFRAAYAVPDGVPLFGRLKALYEGRVADGDPLACLLKPKDQRGEVQGWGGPHITLLDAMTVQRLAEFTRIVQDVCREFDAPVLTAKKLTVWNRKVLVLRCESAPLDQLRAALIAATQGCVHRVSLTDEEIQKAKWVIEQRSKQPQYDLQSLDRALGAYLRAGAPPLPSSRHFRLGFMVKLWKSVEQAEGKSRAGHERGLEHFFEHGVPPWYAGPSALHLTIASGLAPDSDVEQLVHDLEPSILADFPECPLSRIAIMSEDAQRFVKVAFFDWLTETAVEEVRPDFIEIGRAEFR